MASIHRQVDDAIVAMLKRGLPQYEVVGLLAEADRPRRISPHGTVIVWDGDAGDPIIDLSPPTYHFERRIPAAIAAYLSSVPLRDVLDRMAGEIGALVAADRFLGGLVSYLQTSPLEAADLGVAGGQTQAGGTFVFIATYSTLNPL